MLNVGALLGLPGHQTVTHQHTTPHHHHHFHHQPQHHESSRNGKDGGKGWAATPQGAERARTARWRYGFTKKQHDKKAFEWQITLITVARYERIWLMSCSLSAASCSCASNCEAINLHRCAALAEERLKGHGRTSGSKSTNRNRKEGSVGFRERFQS